TAGNLRRYGPEPVRLQIGSAQSSPPSPSVNERRVMAVEIATRTMWADATAIADAARVLSAGGLVAFPTETVYGLAADAANGAAVAGLYAARGGPTFNPLIVHVADPAAARRLGKFAPAASALAAGFWPGPLTLVLPKTDDCPAAELATAGLN